MFIGEGEEQFMYDSDIPGILNVLFAALELCMALKAIAEMTFESKGHQNICARPF